MYTTSRIVGTSKCQELNKVSRGRYDGINYRTWLGLLCRTYDLTYDPFKR